MHRLDPQRTTGVANYPPPAAPCVCGHREAVHAVIGGQRGACSATTTTSECRCRRYEPDTLGDAG